MLGFLITLIQPRLKFIFNPKLRLQKCNALALRINSQRHFIIQRALPQCQIQTRIQEPVNFSDGTFYEDNIEFHRLDYISLSRCFTAVLNKLLNSSQNTLLNPFSTNVPFLYALKTSENLRVSDVFRGYRSGTLVDDGLISLQAYLLLLKVMEVRISNFVYR